MDKKYKQDLKIAGSATAQGGSYNTVVISGHGTIDGDCDCIDLKVSGAATFNGAVKTDSGKVMGTATINGNFTSADFKIGGYLHVHGKMEAGEIVIEGGAVISGGLSAESVEIKGGVKVKNDCNAETFVSKGAFAVNGLLSADSVDIVLYGPCRAKEIGGEKIEVRKSNSYHIARIVKSILLSLDLDEGLTADVIEGDDVYLEDTKAKAVRGNNVIIGDGCEIGLVEYRSKFEQTGNAKVRENKKVR
ncbi:MAG TPA: hypothetical protein VMM58_13945 [Bacteroidota bacterium]|nr:hypothetical protein [Bacteroidota bacterium]